MNYLKLAIRSFFKKSNNNLVKILSLGAGLAVGLILISKVLYEQSYDKFYPESERIYAVHSRYRIDSDDGEKWNSHSRVPGAIAGGIRNEIPGVESVSMHTELEREAPLLTQDKRRLKGNIIMADSCFFDVVPRPMIVGDAKKALSTPMYVLISKSMASKIGGDPIGHSFFMENRPDFTFIIGGIFEDVPKNSSINYDVIVSMESVMAIWNWDPRSNWLGNDRYMVLFKPQKNVSIESMLPAMEQMQERYIPAAELKKHGVEIGFKMLRFDTQYSDSESVKRMNLLLSLLALAIITAAVLNYMLIVISTMVKKSKDMAVYKCHGAQSKNLSYMIFTETGFHLLISLILATLLVFIFRGPVEDILATPLSALFSLKTVTALSGVCLFILLIAGYLPAKMFTRIPVIAVFRNFGGSSRQGWKLSLLFIQFIGAIFLFILLVVIGKQYDAMINNSPGYEYENVVFFEAGASDSLSRSTALNALASLPEVEISASATELLYHGASGNNVFLPGENKELFNIADLYYCDENYIELLNIKITEGCGFNRNSVSDRDVLISRSFAERLINLTGWEDGVIGKDIHITEHGLSTIRGVYENIRIGYIGGEDSRPTAIFYSSYPRGVLLARLREVNGVNIRKVQEAIQQAMPNKEVNVQLYKNNMLEQYTPTRRFRNAVMVGSIVTLIIVLIGLIGYLRNEIIRRGKEIAIRKVNGGKAVDILELFIRNIMYIAIPAVLVGSLISYFVAQKWMESFSVKTSLTWRLFLTCGAIVLLIIIGVIITNCIRIANRNPSDSLKTE